MIHVGTECGEVDIVSGRDFRTVLQGCVKLTERRKSANSSWQRYRRARWHRGRLYGAITASGLVGGSNESEPTRAKAALGRLSYPATPPIASSCFSALSNLPSMAVVSSRIPVFRWPNVLATPQLDEAPARVDPSNDGRAGISPHLRTVGR